MAVPEVRPIKVEGNLAYVTLTKGYVAVIDACDVPLVEGFNWRALVTKRGVYALRSKRCGGRKMKSILMHRVLLGVAAGKLVDHVDRNGLNNSRSNLREATHSENACNSPIRPHNQSGFKGVRKARRKWTAYVTFGKRHYLGMFDTPEAAHEAYCNAAKSIQRGFDRNS
jgi:hypothetical protein